MQPTKASAEVRKKKKPQPRPTRSPPPTAQAPLIIFLSAMFITYPFVVVSIKNVGHFRHRSQCQDIQGNFAGSYARFFRRHLFFLKQAFSHERSDMFSKLPSVVFNFLGFSCNCIQTLSFNIQLDSMPTLDHLLNSSGT